MAGALAGRTDLIQNRVLLTVDPDLEEFQEVPGRQAFDPEFIAGGAPESGLLFLKGRLEGQLIDVAQDEDFTSLGILRHGGDDVSRPGSDFTQFFEVQAEGQAFFEFFIGHGTIWHGRPPAFKAGKRGPFCLTDTDHVAQ